MSWFLHGLNREIQDVVELQHYSTLGELVHQAIKVEMQIRRMSASRKAYVGTSGWKGKEREKEKTKREKSPKKESDSSLGQKEATSTPTPMAYRISNIKDTTSQCPNRGVMVVKNDREIKSESSIGELSASSEVKSLSDDSQYEGDLLVVRRLMNSHKSKTQRENIFHSMCLIFGNLCSMIINWGNCVNVASERLVKKLALPTIVHLRPYRLLWLSEKG
ncbi:hypothetical protein CR513_35812, partial [Mucuna pruriens]